MGQLAAALLALDLAVHPVAVAYLAAVGAVLLAVQVGEERAAAHRRRR